PGQAWFRSSSPWGDNLIGPGAGDAPGPFFDVEPRPLAWSCGSYRGCEPGQHRSGVAELRRRARRVRDGLDRAAAAARQSCIRRMPRRSRVPLLEGWTGGFGLPHADAGEQRPVTLLLGQGDLRRGRQRTRLCCAHGNMMSHLVALRATKIGASDPPTTWWP